MIEPMSSIKKAFNWWLTFQFVALETSSLGKMLTKKQVSTLRVVKKTFATPMQVMFAWHMILG